MVVINIRTSDITLIKKVTVTVQQVHTVPEMIIQQKETTTV